MRYKRYSKILKRNQHDFLQTTNIKDKPQMVNLFFVVALLNFHTMKLTNLIFSLSKHRY
jgi:hypothetical protein